MKMKTLKIITFFLLTVAATTWSQNTNIKCPFQFFYHFGDGITDNGNSVRIPPFGSLLPPTRYPYGKTFPGYPTGRWSDGLTDIDYAGQGLGLPNIKPYLSLGKDLSTSYDGVEFSVQGSTVLDSSFFNSKRIAIPPYNTPLSAQMTWFRRYLSSTCTNQTECAKRQPQNSIMIFEFAEVNDIGNALVQGKSIQEVTTYIPLLVQSQIDVAREVIKLGTTKLIFINAAPLGCYPYILTALSTDDNTAYDELGCLKAVNNIAVKFNTAIQTAFNSLSAEFPNVTLLVGDYYDTTRTVINQTSILGPNGNPALRSCCGIGGRYNYDRKRFCGSVNVPVCPDPENFIYWDGLHFTQETYRRIVIDMLIQPALVVLNCKSI